MEYLNRIDLLLDHHHIWPKQLREWTDIIESELTHALPGTATRDIRLTALRLVARLFQTFGGTQQYIPKPDLLSRLIRNLMIARDHNGRVDGQSGIRALARRHALTEMQVWNILREHRLINRAERVTSIASEAPSYAQA